MKADIIKECKMRRPQFPEVRKERKVVVWEDDPALAKMKRPEIDPPKCGFYDPWSVLSS